MLSVARRQCASVPRTGVQQLSRSLVSTVLLSKSREQWERSTLTTLKREAKTRGLTINGNKSTIINRLLAHDGANELPIVSTAGLAATTSSRPPSSPEPTSVHLRRFTSVSTHRAADQNNDKFKARWSRTLDVKIPEEQEVPEEGPNIPFVAHKFDSPPSQSASPPPEAPSDGPKVLTVASASTHIAGGPLHTLHESVDAHSIELADTKGFAEDVEAKAESWLSGILSDVGLPKLTLPKESAEDSATRELRDLNSEEKRGALALLGIIVGGWLLGVAATPSKPKVEGEEKHEH